MIGFVKKIPHCQTGRGRFMKFPPRSLCAYRPTLSIVTGERFDTLRVIGVGAFFLCAGFALIPLGTTVEALVVTVLVWTFGEMLTRLSKNLLHPRASWAEFAPDQREREVDTNSE
jgi:hypothetical protein